MSSYNSTNTKVLETHEQAGGNMRMLLMHECDSGRIEYVIGSYFQVKPRGRMSFAECHACGNFEPVMENIEDYEWDWGHYFDGILKAVDYWEREVLGVKDDFLTAVDRVCLECAYETGEECEGCMVRRTCDALKS